MARRKRLMITDIDSVGAVDEPDNPPASLLFWKRRITDDEQTSKEAPDSGDIEKGVTMDEGIQEAQEEAAAEVEPVVEKAEPETVEVPEEDVSKADQIAKLAAERDAAVEALAEEVNKRLDTEWVEKARPLELLLGDPAEMGPVLRKIAQACPDEWAKLEPVLTAGANREHLAKILEEIGTADGSAGPIEDRDTWVKRMRELHPDKTVPELRAQFWQEHPDAKSKSREA